jgi:hypothetical protein
MCAPIVAKNAPISPSGVQLQMPIRPPGRPQHPRDLGGRDLVAGGEHAPEGGQHDVEAHVLERQLLGVALDPCHVEAFAVGCRPGVLEQLRHEVEPGHPRACSRSRQRRVTGAARHVEHLFVGRDAGVARYPFTDRRDQLGDLDELAGVPGHLLALLDLPRELLVHRPTLTPGRRCR